LCAICVTKSGYYETLDLPVSVNNAVVGYLISPGSMQIANELDDAFSNELFEQALWIGLSGSTLVRPKSIFFGAKSEGAFSMKTGQIERWRDALISG